VYLDNRTLDGVAGLYVITPLAIADGLPAVLIDRGWMMRDMHDRQRVSAPPPAAGRVTVEGVAVARPSMLLELGDSSARPVPGLWHNLDYAAYERATGRSVARFVVRQRNESGSSDGLRHQWVQPATGVEKHRGYAFQWYSLAALIAAFATWSSWKSWPR
jgi:cytochrome oxidase assembly protein ShyY1